MNEGLIPRRYAKALYKYALEKGRDKALYEMMERLAESYAREPALAKAMANPFVDPSQKLTLMLTACGAEKDDAVLHRFFDLLSENHRIGLAGDIARAYGDIYREANNIHRVTITSAAPLDADTVKRIEQVVKRHIGGGTVDYTTAVNPDLIGGFTVNIDNDRLDASVATELKQMRLKLLSI
ncbi:MAG: ATP synthase F1 subunit delta [Candidatus Amulumruptor caecigallinarius]|nr:ATP synthase F1 subunit delta [Candidatus Amulumruptor caecigallinarius]MCM1397591.1 ATP synthase F1 subunit delta [Candidatus Amulumruptor caecigallinarius]MCM1454095.1 ATP synthase F1 subunit delta [bacterium]